MIKKADNMENEKQLLSPEALRALAEAKKRYRAQHGKKEPMEIGGRGGKEPTRYGDWEIKGRSIDF
ncbi:MAG: hypothetical protein JSC189_000759 [Candidatus Tokpelaia sp. JSC189]|nr:MAG: hypothetical protein JSC189_000759 [Candidatus Tokpelaia sp. JSC189]